MTKTIIRIFIIWQLVLLAISLLVGKIIPYTNSPFVYRTPSSPLFLSNRANFDGVHYISIAQRGYGFAQQAFFPMYPRLIRFVSNYFGGNYLYSAVFISTLALLAGIYLFYRLVEIDHGVKVAKRSLLLWLTFPTAFFFSMAYTESLFVALVLGTFYSARKNKWLLAGILGAFAANTRIVGIFLFPALLYEWYQVKKITLPINNKHISQVLSIFVILLGLLFYIYHLLIAYGDPLKFLHVQPAFGASRSMERLILIYQVFYRYLKMILTTKLALVYLNVWFELISAIGFLYLLIKAYLQKIRLSYLIFAFGAFLLPSLTGTFSSLPRYVLVLFPAFIVLGRITSPILRKSLIGSFILLQIIFCLLFLSGYWVA